MTRPRVLFFDINETLLDLSALRPGFVEIFGSAEMMGEWFARLLHASLVSNHLGNYRPFDLLGVEALLSLAQRRHITLDAKDAVRVVGGMQALPPHPEVPEALTGLVDAGFRLAALTNNSPEVLAAQLEHADLTSLFEKLLSVEGVRRFKPAPEVYVYGATMMEVEVDQALLIASHDWDVAGARSVGMGGAFLARPAAIWGLPDDPPEIVAPDLTTLAALLAAD